LAIAHREPWVQQQRQAELSAQWIEPPVLEKRLKTREHVKSRVFECLGDGIEHEREIQQRGAERTTGLREITEGREQRLEHQRQLLQIDPLLGIQHEILRELLLAMKLVDRCTRVEQPTEHRQFGTELELAMAVALCATWSVRVALDLGSHAVVASEVPALAKQLCGCFLLHPHDDRLLEYALDTSKVHYTRVQVMHESRWFSSFHGAPGRGGIADARRSRCP